jgi:hypothetical protein
MTVLPARRALPAPIRAVGVVGGPMALGAAALTVLASHLDRFDPTGHPRMPWLLLVLLFAVAQSSVVDIQVKRQARSISLTDAPFVLGLFLVAPMPFVAARVLGGFGTQLVLRRQYREPLKLLFNTITCFGEGAVGLVVFLLVDAGAAPDQPRAWAAALLAATAANVCSGLGVALLIAKLEQPRRGSRPVRRRASASWRQLRSR